MIEPIGKKIKKGKRVKKNWRESATRVGFGPGSVWPHQALRGSSFSFSKSKDQFPSIDIFVFMSQDRSVDSNPPSAAK